MHVESTLSSAPQGWAWGRTARSEKPNETSPPAGDSPDQALAGAAEADGDEGQPGVIRNLLSGHYKGVADVRLRINFYDELTALEQGGVAQALAEPSAALGEMTDQLAGLAELGEDLPPEVAQAVAGLQEAAAAFTDAGDMGRQEALDLLAGLKEAFGRLIEQLQAYMQTRPVEPEPTGDDPPADPLEQAAAAEPPVEVVTGDAVPEPTAEPPAGEPLAETPAAEPAEEVLPAGTDPFEVVDGFLAQWGDLSILEQLASLEQSVGQVSALPALSGPPDNQGAAYAKFLAIYQEMQAGVAGDAAEAEPTGEVETVV